jgi:hypothetical protein
VRLRNSGFLMITMLPASLAAFICDFPPQGFASSARVNFRGRYANDVYRYAVVIPKGTVGSNAPPPAPQHGFGLTLGARNASYVLVNGEANSFEYASATAAAQGTIRSLQRSMKIVKSTVISSSRMGGLDAAVVTVTYACPGSPEEFVLTSHVALSPDRRAVYEVALYAHASRYEADLPIFRRLVESWRYLARSGRAGRQ